MYEKNVLKQACWTYKTDPRLQLIGTIKPSIYDYTKYMNWNFGMRDIQDIEIIRLFESSKLKVKELCCVNNMFYYMIKDNLVVVCY